MCGVHCSAVTSARGRAAAHRVCVYRARVHVPHAASQAIIQLTTSKGTPEISHLSFHYVVRRENAAFKLKERARLLRILWEPAHVACGGFGRLCAAYIYHSARACAYRHNLNLFLGSMLVCFLLCICAYTYVYTHAPRGKIQRATDHGHVRGLFFNELYRVSCYVC